MQREPGYEATTLSYILKNNSQIGVSRHATILPHSLGLSVCLCYVLRTTFAHLLSVILTLVSAVGSPCYYTMTTKKSQEQVNKKTYLKDIGIEVPKSKQIRCREKFNMHNSIPKSFSHVNSNGNKLHSLMVWNSTGIDVVQPVTHPRM